MSGPLELWQSPKQMAEIRLRCILLSILSGPEENHISGASILHQMLQVYLWTADTPFLKENIHLVFAALPVKGVYLLFWSAALHITTGKVYKVKVNCVEPQRVCIFLDSCNSNSEAFSYLCLICISRIIFGNYSSWNRCVQLSTSAQIWYFSFIAAKVKVNQLPSPQSSS